MEHPQDQVELDAQQEMAAETPDDPVQDEGNDREHEERVAGISAWGISITVHALALIIIGFVVIAKELVKETFSIKITTLDEPPAKEEVKPKRDLIEKPQSRIDSDLPPVENPTITTLDMVPEEVSTEDPEEKEHKVRGREEAVSTSEMGGTGAFMAIGAGGSGTFGFRNGGGRKRAVGRFGGSQGSESAVEAALKWFAIHQSPNGQWDGDGYPVNCTPLALGGKMPSFLWLRV